MTMAAPVGLVDVVAEPRVAGMRAQVAPRSETRSAERRPIPQMTRTTPPPREATGNVVVVGGGDGGREAARRALSSREASRPLVHRLESPHPLRAAQGTNHAVEIAPDGDWVNSIF